MGVDRTGGTADDFEKVQTHHADGWSLRPDRPGAEPNGPSRADSRAAAAATTTDHQQPQSDQHPQHKAADSSSVTQGVEQRDASDAEGEAGTVDRQEADKSSTSRAPADSPNEARPNLEEAAPDREQPWSTTSAEDEVSIPAEAQETDPTDARDQQPTQRPPDMGVTEAAGQDRRWRTIAEEVGEVRSYPSFEAARREIDVQPGREIHHIVEQAQAKPERSGFGAERINTTDNLAELPADVHSEVSRHYSTRPPGADATVRDTLTGMPWDDQHQYGCEAINDAWERVERARDPTDAGAEPSWRTVAEEAGEVRSYPSFEAARRELDVRPGREIHHIVEQAQAKPERSGFGAERINTTDNLAELPADVHSEVSRHYSTRPPGADATVRDTLTGMPWDDQHQYGCEAINDAWRRVRSDGEDRIR